MNAKNQNTLQRAMSSSDKVLMAEALKISIKSKEADLQRSAEAHDYAEYRRNANQFAHLSETLYNLQNS